jgi:hypothetical protein
MYDELEGCTTTELPMMPVVTIATTKFSPTKATTGSMIPAPLTRTPSQSQSQRTPSSLQPQQTKLTTWLSPPAALTSVTTPTKKKNQQEEGVTETTVDANTHLTTIITTTTTQTMSSVPMNHPPKVSRRPTIVHPRKHQHCIVYLDRYKDFFGRTYPPPKQPMTTPGLDVVITDHTYYNPADHWVLATILDGPTSKKKRKTIDDEEATDPKDHENGVEKVEEEEDMLVNVQLNDTSIFKRLSIHEVRLLVPKHELSPSDVQFIHQRGTVEGTSEVGENDEVNLLYPIDFYGRLVVNLSKEYLVARKNKNKRMKTTTHIDAFGSASTATEPPYTSVAAPSSDPQPLWFCHLRPTRLYIGDQVLAFFQNGNAHLDRNTPHVLFNAWYRGRVLRTVTGDNDNDDQILNHSYHSAIKTVDIAYDDGDVEKDVPMPSYTVVTNSRRNNTNFATTINNNINPTGHHIILLQRGWSNPYWLRHLKSYVHPFRQLPTKDPKRDATITGIVMDDSPNTGSVQRLGYQRYLRVKCTNDERCPIYLVPYEEVAKGAFTYEIQNPKTLNKTKTVHTSYKWPILMDRVDDTKGTPRRTITKATTHNFVKRHPLATQINTTSTKSTNAQYTITKNTIELVDSSDDDDVRNTSDQNGENKATGRMNSDGEAFEEEDDDEYLDDEDDYIRSGLKYKSTKPGPSLQRITRAATDTVNSEPSMKREIRLHQAPTNERPRRNATKRPVRYNDDAGMEVDDGSADKIAYTPAKRNRTVPSMVVAKNEKEERLRSVKSTTVNKSLRNATTTLKNTGVAKRRSTKKQTMTLNNDDEKDSHDSTEIIHGEDSNTMIASSKQCNVQGTSVNNATIQMEVPAIAETVWEWSSTVPTMPQELTNGTREADPSSTRTTSFTVMDSTVANAFGKALHSSDAVMAADLISFMACRSTVIPNDTMWKFIIELNTFGPRLDGVCYPDITKMNATVQYLQYILTIPGVLDRCCKFIDHEFHKIHWLSAKSNKDASNSKSKQLLSYVEAFCMQMSSNYYLVNSDDIHRHTKSAYNRIHAQIHAKVCFAEVFIKLLRHQLHTMIIQQHVNGKKKSTADYHTLPIVRDILTVQRGVKGVLERMATAYTIIWTQFGLPFVINAGKLYAKANGDTSFISIIQEIQRETVRLTELLGIGISYVAWIYSNETNEGPYAIADIIGQVYYREVDDAKKQIQEASECSTNKSLQPSLSMSDYTELETILKIRFLATIDKNIVPQLRPKLAEQFHVAGAYNILYAEM